MRIALSGRAYSGKTTLARELERRDFKLVDYTGYIKRYAAMALFQTTGIEITPEMIERNKKDYRAYLQGFAQLGGFNGGAGVLDVLRPDSKTLVADMVFDNVRTMKQFELLEPYGFVLATIRTPVMERFRRAQEEHGITEHEFAVLCEHHTERDSPMGPVLLDGTQTTDALATVLCSLKAREYAAN